MNRWPGEANDAAAAYRAAICEEMRATNGGWRDSKALRESMPASERKPTLYWPTQWKGVRRDR